jgi:hypothetical protein
VRQVDLLKAKERLKEGQKLASDAMGGFAVVLVHVEVQQDIVNAIEKLKLSCDELEAKLQEVSSLIALTVRCFDLLNQVLNSSKFTVQHIVC